MTSNTTQKNEALEQLRLAILACKEAGIGIGVGPMFNSESSWHIYLTDDNIIFDGHRFEAIE